MSTRCAVLFVVPVVSFLPALMASQSSRAEADRVIFVPIISTVRSKHRPPTTIRTKQRSALEWNQLDTHCVLDVAWSRARQSGMLRRGNDRRVGKKRSEFDEQAASPSSIKSNRRRSSHPSEHHGERDSTADQPDVTRRLESLVARDLIRQPIAGRLPVSHHSATSISPTHECLLTIDDGSDIRISTVDQEECASIPRLQGTSRTHTSNGKRTHTRTLTHADDVAAVV